MVGSGFHAKRWALVWIWIVLFTGAGVWGFQIQKDQSDKLCRVTDAFITANLEVQNAQTQETLQELGLRKEVIAAAARTINALAHKPLTKADNIILYLQAQVTLNRTISHGSRATLQAHQDAATNIRKLRRELKCES